MLKEMEKLAGLHNIIKQKYKGSPDEIANKLDISRSCLYNYIEKLTILGAEISYSRSQRCFKYTNAFKLKITFETNDMIKIIGEK